MRWNVKIYRIIEKKILFWKTNELFRINVKIIIYSEKKKIRINEKKKIILKKIMKFSEWIENITVYSGVFRINSTLW